MWISGSSIWIGSIRDAIMIGLKVWIVPRRYRTNWEFHSYNWLMSSTLWLNGEGTRLKLGLLVCLILLSMG